MANVDFWAKELNLGAAPAGKDICDEVIKKYPNIEYIEQGYGMTELSTASHMPDLGSRTKFGSCGKLCPGLQMKVLLLETFEYKL